MKHWNPRKPLAMTLFLALVLGIATTGNAFTWPWDKPSEATLAQATLTPAHTITPTEAPIEKNATGESALIASRCGKRSRPTASVCATSARLQPGSAAR